MPNIDDPLNLARVMDFFPRGLNQDALLPVVFGDFISSTHVHDDGEDGGYLPAVSIDRDNWVYLLNGLPNVAGPIEIYLNDTRQEASVFTYVPMADYGGIGHLIAYVQFHHDPGSRAVSWNGRGARAWPATTLMTHPIDAISYMFSAYGGWTAQDTDWSSIMETKRLMTLLGDTINLCFWERRTYREWLEIILQLYHTDISLDSNGKLRFSLDTSVTTQPTNVLATLDARRDLAGSEAEPLIIRRAPDDIVTEITAHGRRKWTTGVSATKPRVSYAPGVSKHGIRHREYELPGLYSIAQFERWLRGMWLRYGQRADRVLFTVRGLSLMSALPGQFLGMISPKRGWQVPQLLKVLNCETNDAEQTISFECFDTQRAVDSTVSLPTVVMPSVRTRPIQDSLTVDLKPPGPAANLVGVGGFRRILLHFTVPGDLDYAHTEIWGSQTNNRATAQNFRNGALFATPGSAVEESFDVENAAIWYVWLMTVDRSGNGANGGTGPTGGHWHPDSPTGGPNGSNGGQGGGMRVQAARISTQEIIEQAVNKEYRTASQRAPGTYTGPLFLATADLPDDAPQGRVLATGALFVTLQSLQTLLLEIRRDGVNGPVIGASAPLINPLTVQATFRCDVWGLDFDPHWPGTYYLMARVVNQAGTSVPFVVSTAAQLFLVHQAV